MRGRVDESSQIFSVRDAPFLHVKEVWRAKGLTYTI
jgi:hypothetical protein